MASLAYNGIIVQNQSAEDTNAVLRDLATISHNAYPDILIMLVLQIVGYDNAVVWAQWEE
jgi:hypothetical protein